MSCDCLERLTIRPIGIRYLVQGYFAVLRCSDILINILPWCQIEKLFRMKNIQNSILCSQLATLIGVPVRNYR